VDLSFPPVVLHVRLPLKSLLRYAHVAAREERICRRAELDFGRALPPELGAPVVERALASLELADAEVAPSIDWNEAMRRQQAVDDQRLQP
jgi:hypothetical protein